jgi:hypothetical protein
MSSLLASAVLMPDSAIVHSCGCAPVGPVYIMMHTGGLTCKYSPMCACLMKLMCARGGHLFFAG